MIIKIGKRILNGVLWGCTVSCLVSMAGVALTGYGWLTSAPRGFIAQVVAAIIVGIGFSVPAAVYENEKLSFAQHFIIHMGIGMGIYVATALYMGWIPSGNPMLAVYSLVIAAFFSLLIWSCFYFYYRWMAKEMNRRIKKEER